MSGSPWGSADLGATLEASVRLADANLHVPALTILAHPDPRRIAAWSPLPDRVELGRVSPVFEAHGPLPASPLEDRFLSRQPILLTVRPDGSARLDKNDSRNGLEVDGVPLEGPLELDAGRVAAGVVLELGARVALLLHNQRLPRPNAPERLGFVGFSRALEDVREAIDAVAPLDVPVLIRGESGVGKELVARAIHRASGRADGPYEAVNMAAIPAHLAAAELFGHEKGAFTGADQARAGYFARTDGGTLFLDEVGDTPGEIQPQLLRALETHDIHPVGATASRTIDVRVISATDARLEEAVARAQFRDALLHRLAGYQIHVPALRERKEDIGLLFLHFVRAELSKIDALDRIERPDERRPWLPSGVVARLARHPWPGNVRELRNVARQRVIRSLDRQEMPVGPELERVFVSPPSAAAPSSSDVYAPASGEHRVPTPSEERSAPPPRSTSYVDPADIAPERLLEVLREHAFRVAPAAKALGLSRTSMYTLMEQSPHVRKAVDLTAAEIESALDATGGRLSDAAVRLEVSAHALKLRMTALGIRR